jgi:DNA-binding FadR family transcriptional regulator
VSRESDDVGKDPITRGRKFAQVVADDLRARIGRGELRAGEPLPSEQSLIKSYGVSRPTLREAMRILESESLVSVRLGSKGGIFVRYPDPDVAVRQSGLLLQLGGVTVGDAYMARVAMEPTCVRWLAERHDARVVVTLRRLCETLKAIEGDVMASALGSNEFHEKLVELTENMTLYFSARVIRNLLDATFLEWPDFLQDEGTFKRIAHTRKNYDILINLIEAGKADASEQHWRNHLSQVASNRLTQSSLLVARVNSQSS